MMLERELELRQGRRKAKVYLRFGEPRLVGRDFRCIYQIEGLDDEPRVRVSYGVDGVQALWLAMQVAMTELVASLAYQQGRLTWLGRYDLGLPVMDEIRGLVRKDAKPPRRRRRS